MNLKAVVAAVATMFVIEASVAAGVSEREKQALKSARYPLAEAVRVAQEKGGGPAIDAEFGMEENRSEYEIKVLSADGRNVREFEIDATTGSVKEIESEPFESLFTRLKADSIMKAPMDLATAVLTAQKLAGGMALEAEIDPEGDAVVYNIKVVKGSAVETVRINAVGKVASAE
jgi:uncharacterized membrane protein YkoI